MADDETMQRPALGPVAAVVVGRRLFDTLSTRLELEVMKVIDTPQATHIRYRVKR